MTQTQWFEYAKQLCECPQEERVCRYIDSTRPTPPGRYIRTKDVYEFDSDDECLRCCKTKCTQYPDKTFEGIDCRKVMSQAWGGLNGDHVYCIRDICEVESLVLNHGWDFSYPPDNSFTLVKKENNACPTEELTYPEPLDPTSCWEGYECTVTKTHLQLKNIKWKTGEEPSKVIGELYRECPCQELIGHGSRSNPDWVTFLGEFCKDLEEKSNTLDIGQMLECDRQTLQCTVK